MSAAAREAAEAAARQAAKEAAESAARSAAREAAEAAARAASREAAEAAARAASREAAEAAARAASKEAAEAAARAASREAAEAAARKAAQEAAEAATKDSIASTLRSSVGRDVSEAEIRKLANSAFKDASKAANPGKIAKVGKIADESIAKKTLSTSDRALLKDGRNMVQRDAVETMGKAKALQKESGNILTRNPKLAALFASAGGFALYCVIKGKSPADAAKDLLSSAGQGLKDIGKEAANTLGEMFGTFFKGFFGSLGKGLKIVGIIILVIIVLVLMMKLFGKKKGSGGGNKLPAAAFGLH